MNSQSINTCTHEELLELDQTHAYTAVSNSTMMVVLGNIKIASAVRLWLLIRFQQSGFKDREYVERPIGWIAKQLAVSTSTIQKWQRILESEGYLEIIEQRRERRQNRPNRYRATLPKSAQEVLSQEKERTNVYTIYIKGARSKINSREDDKKLKEHENNGHSKSPIKRETCTGTETSINADKEKDDKKEASNIIEKPNRAKNEAQNKNVRGTSSKIAYEIKAWCDKTTLSTDNNKQKQEQKEIPNWFKQALNGYQYEYDNTQRVTWITGPNQFAIRVFQEHQQALIEAMNQAGIPVEAIRFNRDKRGVSTEKTRRGQTPEQPKNSLKIPKHTLNRIRRRLQRCTVQGEPLQPKLITTLTEQLAFSVTSGSLKGLDPIKAINIGIKLIRENRWRTPSGYPQGGSHIG